MIFADGTFKVCPAPFYQLYILHVPLGNWMRPCLYCLLSRKTRFTYDVLFGCLRAKAAEANHPMICTRFRCDYEVAVIQSILTTFPGITVTGCFFHLCSAMYKKAMELGLSIPYRDETTLVRRTVKKCMALAFLQPAIIGVVFQHIKLWYAEQVVPEPRVDLTDFFLYVQQSWIEGGVASVDVWSIFDEPRRRTNNDLEGYNSRLKRELGCNRNLWMFMKKMLHEEENMRKQVLRLDFQMPLQEGRSKRQNKMIAEYREMYLSHQLTAFQYVSNLTSALPN